MLKEKKSPGKYSKSFFRRRYPNSEDGMLLQNPFIVKKQAEIPAPGTLILIGTDGIWEAKNKTGDRFGKQRVKEVMRGNSDKSSS